MQSSFGNENIEWLVLEVKEGKALVISKYALECKKYNASYTSVTWETCSLRKWLNGDFINTAFSAYEKAMIPLVTISADYNSEYTTNLGNATEDQVFLLSITEANTYFDLDIARQCKPSDLVANVTMESNNGKCWWWLRSPGISQDFAAYVNYFGDIYTTGYRVDINGIAVRPALWIDLNI